MFWFNHRHQGECYSSLKAQIARSLMLVNKLKCVGVFSI